MVDGKKVKNKVKSWHNFNEMRLIFFQVTTVKNAVKVLYGKTSY